MTARIEHLGVHLSNEVDNYIKEYYETPEGQEAFAAWQQEQEERLSSLRD